MDIERTDTTMSSAIRCFKTLAIVFKNTERTKNRIPTVIDGNKNVTTVEVTAYMSFVNGASL